MHCHSVSPRYNWREQIAARGYDVSLLEHPPYWIESIDEPFCVVFSRHEIENLINRATSELTRLALDLVEEVCRSGQSEHYFDRLNIAPPFRESIRRSWKRHDKSLYGRFDFALNNGSLKLLELNFDTPTSLYESAHLQRMWLEEMRQFQEIPFAATQNNSIQQKLIATLRLHFSAHEIFHLGTFEHAREEIENLKYLQSCADSAGLKTQFIYLDDVRYDAEGRLIDREGRQITCLFKLFPWELLFIEDAKSFSATGKYLFSPLVTSNQTTFIEPAWKSILSNKGILPLLCAFTGDREFLLEASFDDGSDAARRISGGSHVSKPIYGREGQGITLQDESGRSITTEENSESVQTMSLACTESAQTVFVSGTESVQNIVQTYTPLPTYRDYFLVIGSWVVGDEPAGISVRADRSKITGRNALFVPHYITE